MSTSPSQPTPPPPLPPLIKTRILILSDTHGVTPAPATSPDPPSPLLLPAFRHPLPAADLVLHCGDLTKRSAPAEFAATLGTLAGLRAPLKLAIPGNHDGALEHHSGRRRGKDSSKVVAGMVARARARGVEVLVREGSYRFVLANGARLAVYASAWTPSYGGWAFQFEGGRRFDVERGTDVVLTHGPPRGVLDRTRTGAEAGSEDLWAAVARARPRVHCFGHIHEAWGARVVRWRVASGRTVGTDDSAGVRVDDLETMEGGRRDGEEVRAEKLARRNRWAERRARVVSLCESNEEEQGEAGVDAAGLPRPFEYGRDTLFVNAAIVSIGYQPRQMPWLIELELPRADEEDVRRAAETAALLEQAAREAEGMADAASAADG